MSTTRYAPGDPVRHTVFGDGVVTEVTSGRLATVTFSAQGEKIFSMDEERLQPIKTPADETVDRSQVRSTPAPRRGRKSKSKPVAKNPSDLTPTERERILTANKKRLRELGYPQKAQPSRKH